MSSSKALRRCPAVVSSCSVLALATACSSFSAAGFGDTIPASDATEVAGQALLLDVRIQPKVKSKSVRV